MRDDSRQHGFSLVEVLVSLLVLSSVMLGVTAVYVSNQRAYERGQAQVETHQNARVGLEMMARELRMAGYDPLNQIPATPTPLAIQTATATSVSFLGDLTGDDTLDRVTYSVQGGRLIREISSWDGAAFPAPAGSEVADGLSRLRFAYFDGTEPTNVDLGAPVIGGSLANIRRITIVLETAEQTVAGVRSSFPLVVDVRPRNLS